MLKVGHALAAQFATDRHMNSHYPHIIVSKYAISTWYRQEGGSGEVVLLGTTRKEASERAGGRGELNGRVTSQKKNMQGRPGDLISAVGSRATHNNLFQDWRMGLKDECND